MTFYLNITADILLAVILCLHIAQVFVSGFWRILISAVNICLHGALLFFLLRGGSSPEEALMLLLASALVALLLGLREERRSRR